MNRGVTWVVIALLVSMFGIELTSALQESPIIDEGIHLAAGASYWFTGDFRMNPEHPPLIKLLAAFPLLFTNVRVPTDHESWGKWNGWEFGDEFMNYNRVPLSTMLILGRMPIMVLSVFLGWLVYRASREMFGSWPAVLSLALYALDPNIIAHSRYITTDLGFTAFAFLSIYQLNRLLQQPSRRNSILFGTTLLAAGLSKFSGIALVVIVTILLIAVKIREPQHPVVKGRNVRRWLLVGIPLAFLITWAIYGFDIRKPSDDPRIHQLYTQREELLKTKDPATLPPLERFVVVNLGDRAQALGAQLEAASSIPIPAYAFFRGMFMVLGHSIGGQESYLLGSTSERGWWYYFPVAFIVKTPLPTLVAFIAVCLVVVKITQTMARSTGGVRSALKKIDRRWMLYGVPPFVFMLIAMTSNLNLGWRHIMPIYPFLFVLAGSLGQLPIRGPAWRRAIVPGLLIVNLAVVQVGAFPNEMGFFSSLVGGSRTGPRILLDSNLDWGQDLPKLAKYIREQRISELPFAYYGRAKVEMYVPEARYLPTTEEVARTNEPEGLVAISVGQLFRTDGMYRWLWNKQPFHVVGSSIYLYRLR